MWPHSLTVGLGGKAISVGTDDPDVLAILEPWRISDVPDPVDYCLELHPAERARGAPRRLPGLYHGSTALFRTQDTGRLTTAFRRVLASHGRPPGDGQVRVALMPLMCNGAALLVPPVTLAGVPDRWLAAHGIEAVHTVSSLVDARTAQVLIDPPLGSGDDEVAPALAGWWLPPQPCDEALSPGFAVAEVMSLAIDVTADNAASVLRAVAMLVERAHPAFAPPTVEAIKDHLASGPPQSHRR